MSMTEQEIHDRAEVIRHERYNYNAPLCADEKALIAASDLLKQKDAEIVELAKPERVVPEGLKKEALWRVNDIAEMLQERGVGGSRIYGCDEWSAPVKNLKNLAALLSAAPEPEVGEQQEALRELHKIDKELGL